MENEKKLFEKGGAPGPGRPKGSVSVKTYLRTAQVLANLGRHPIEELIKIADATENTEEKKNLWLIILSYTEVPQREPVPLVSQTPEESKALADARWAEANAYATPSEPTPQANP